MRLASPDACAPRTKGRCRRPALKYDVRRRRGCYRFAMRRLLPAVLVLGACAHAPTPMNRVDFLDTEVRVTTHRDGDDLLSAGLGLAGLRAPQAPAPADPAAPTAQELRRRAFHTNWRGIADLTGAQGFGIGYGAVPTVPGREFQAFARVPGARQPHRVLAQVPDAFDRQARCLLVAASSGSRGPYGAMALAGAWGLPRGCAVVHTDKGTGTGFYDVASGTGVALDGTRAERGSTPLEFEPEVDGAPALAVAIKHAHSRDNPEADWGRHVLQAARFGLHALDLAFPAQAPFTAANTRIIAVGISNGGGAVLRAGELDTEGLFDAVVAAAPNITAPAARTLYDYGTEAALLQPCAQLALHGQPQLLPEAAWRGLATLRCASLRAQGLVDGDTPEAQAADALARLRAGGWSEGALRLSGLMSGLDLWRAVAATYMQAYTRATLAAPACGYTYAALDPAGKPRASSVAERALWFSDSTGVAPTAGVGLVDTLAAAPDPALPGLLCARALWTGNDASAQALHAGVEATRATARPLAPLTLIVHGRDDGLVPFAFTAGPYAQAARESGAALRLWVVPDSQHFDAFLSLPVFAGYVPLLPPTFRALEHAWAAIVDGTAPPPDSDAGVP